MLRAPNHLRTRHQIIAGAAAARLHYAARCRLQREEASP